MYGLMATGEPETAAIIGCRVVGTVRHMRAHTGAIRTMTVMRMVGTITRVIGIMTTTAIIMNTTTATETADNCC